MCWQYEQWHNLDAVADPGSFAGKMRAERGMPHENEYEGLSFLFYKDRATYDRIGKLDGEEKEIHRATMRGVMADNANFIDIAMTPSLLCRAQYEAGALMDVHPKDLPDKIRQNVVAFPIARPAGVSRTEFQDRWKHIHGPIVEANLAALGGVKYMQLHNEIEVAGGAFGGDMHELEGLAVVWTDPDAPRDKDAARAAAAALLEDERKFIDLPRSYLQFVTPLFSSAPPGAGKILPYDGPVSPVAEAFPFWTGQVAEHLHQDPAAKL